MAARPPLILSFDTEGCPDCGSRRVQFPPLPVPVPDDFDWTARDWDGFRRVMLESLASDNPDRARWSAADLEVTLVELLAASLDRFSHGLDAIFAERFLATARWPRSVVRLLSLIDGVAPALAALTPLLDPRERARFGFDAASQPDQALLLLGLLRAHPQLIETAKAAGLAEVTRIQSLISIGDVTAFLQEVPCFAQVAVRSVVEGGIATYEGSVLMLDSSVRLDDRISSLGPGRADDMVAFFESARLRLSPPFDNGFTAGSPLDALSAAEIRDSTIRAAVLALARPLLPLSSGLCLRDGRRIGVFLRLCIEVDARYFRSEVDVAVRQLLSARPEGFFDQENFGFDVPLYLSDLQAALMALPGVAGVIVSSLRLVGDPGSEATGSGVLRPPPNAALTLDAANPGPETGYYALKLTGGLIG